VLPPKAEDQLLAGGYAQLNSRFVGWAREDYKQKPDYSYADAVVDPLGLICHERVRGVGDKTEALSHKAKSGEQSNNSEGSQ
jgi:hypothetical protein